MPDISDMTYEEILALTRDEIPDVVQLPKGSYLLRTIGAKFNDRRDEDTNPFALFTSYVKEPMSDVDAEDLSALGDDYSFKENRLFTRVYIETGADLGRVIAICNAHGVDTSTGNLKDWLAGVKGKDVIGFLDYDEFKNKSGDLVKGNKVSSWKAVE